MEYIRTFPTGSVRYIFEERLENLEHIIQARSSVVLTADELLPSLQERLPGFRILSFPGGEPSKCIETVERMAEAMLELECDRNTILVGIGGGLVTDVTGYLGASYMRGIRFGYVPSTLLGMVDAAVGGKCGVNTGMYKNVLGAFRQPSFILYDTSLLSTLPHSEWSNGFAEIIKYGCIADVRILHMLRDKTLRFFQGHPQELSSLIAGCVEVKNKIVMADEDEQGLRRILNFGHTAAHAFERLTGLAHGQAVGLGMRVAIWLSEKHAGLRPGLDTEVCQLLTNYGLPTTVTFDFAEAMRILRRDKKRQDDQINYVLLEQPGVAVVQRLSFEEIEEGMVAVYGTTKTKSTQA